MEQRQPRLGDVLDDYCPRERRVTNHVVVAKVGSEVKQTRCTTCDAEHEYKHAKVPRQRKKQDAPAALYSQVLAGGPKRVSHPPEASGLPLEPEAVTAIEEQDRDDRDNRAPEPLESNQPPASATSDETTASESTIAASQSEEETTEPSDDLEEGPVHRPLIRATLPRVEGQPPPTRPMPEFTIRQPGGGRPNRFRHRHGRGGQQFQNNRNGNMAGGQPRGGGIRPGGGRPPMSRVARHQGLGRKRSK
jgi:hypothetical protein